MKLNQLRVFESVARHLSITVAARELHISQPAVSAQLKRLEEDYGSVFFKRGQRGVELTRDGQTFLDAIGPLLAHAERVDAMLRRANGAGKAEVLTVGGNHTLSVTVIAEVLAEFRKRHPDVQVVLETKENRLMENCVKNGEVEVALISNPTHSPRCVYEPFKEHDIIACVHPASPLAGTVMSLEELTSHPLVVRTGSSSLKELERLGFELKLAVQCEATEAVRIAVQRGMGVGIVFKARVESEIRSGRLCMIDVPELKKIKSRSYVAYKKHRALSKPAQDFIEMLRGFRADPA